MFPFCRTEVGLGAGNVGFVIDNDQRSRCRLTAASRVAAHLCSTGSLKVDKFFALPVVKVSEPVSDAFTGDGLDDFALIMPFADETRWASAHLA